MGLTKLISRYVGYNHWANEEMTRWLKTLESSILYNETLSSFKSIDLTIQHMISAQNFWLAYITESGFTDSGATIKSDSVTSRMNELLSGSQKMINQFTKYTESELLQELKANDMIQSRYNYILHVVNHTTYHRGQIVTLCRSQGVVNNIPNTDYEVFLWSEHHKKTSES